jgi:acetate kinase
VHQLAKHTNSAPESLNLVVAHLGSGASACCIRAGKSIDTSMGLTPLEGLVGGTRTGNIDPTAIMHHTPEYADDAGLHGMRVSRGEWVMNRESGLTALAGTPNFGTISSKAFGTVGEEGGAEDDAEKQRMRLAYDVFLDRVMVFLGQYLAKLLAQVPLRSVQLVFSGGIGENAARLRRDAVERLHWLGASVGDANEVRGGGAVRKVSAEDSRLAVWVVETDEEGWCAQMARDDMSI